MCLHSLEFLTVDLGLINRTADANIGRPFLAELYCLGNGWFSKVNSDTCHIVGVIGALLTNTTQRERWCREIHRGFRN